MKQAQFIKEVKKLLSKRGHYYSIELKHTYYRNSLDKAKRNYDIYSADSAIGWISYGSKSPESALSALKKRLKELDESPQPSPSTD